MSALVQEDIMRAESIKFSSNLSLTEGLRQYSDTQYHDQ